MSQPDGRLLAPARGSRAHSGRDLVVRWDAHDPDGGKLNVTIDCPADPGRTWCTVYGGPSTGRAVVHGSSL